jgi:hypothetical protein
MDTKHFSHLEKKMYLGHQCYLVKGHPYRRDLDAFNGQMELTSAPLRVSTADFLQRAKEHEAWLAKTHASEDREDLVHTHVVKRKSFFFYLPYWQVRFS